jgi:hypothetical protein
MITISGQIVRGLSAATQTLKFQMPHFLKVCPELQSCHLGTINVILDAQLEITPDVLVGPINWAGTPPGEVFGLLKVRFEIEDPQMESEAWIYIPYGSPHRLNPYYAEILAPLLSFSRSPACKIHFSAGRVWAIKSR